MASAEYDEEVEVCGIASRVKSLSRSTGHRTALRRNLVTELFRHERIRTTRAKAQAIRGQAEKMITLAKRGLVAAEADPAKVCMHAVWLLRGLMIRSRSEVVQ